MQDNQFSLFPQATAASTSLRGLTVTLPRACNACGSKTGTLGSSAGPHAAAILCSDCCRHCGWLPAKAAEVIATAIDLWGRPVDPVALRGLK